MIKYQTGVCFDFIQGGLLESHGAVLQRSCRLIAFFDERISKDVGNLSQPTIFYQVSSAGILTQRKTADFELSENQIIEIC